MSKGPGRIERIIAETFEQHPDEPVSLQTLCWNAYPLIRGEPPEKKHRVAVYRASRKVCERMGWGQHWSTYFSLRSERAYVLAHAANDLRAKLKPRYPLPEKPETETQKETRRQLDDLFDRYAPQKPPEPPKPPPELSKDDVESWQWWKDHFAVDLAKLDGGEPDPAAVERIAARNKKFERELEAMRRANERKRR